MEGIIPALGFSAKERLCRQLRKCRDSKLRTRYLVVINLANGRSAEQTAAAIQVARSSVYRIALRFREAGEAGLIDRREDRMRVEEPLAMKGETHLREHVGPQDDRGETGQQKDQQQAAGSEQRTTHFQFSAPTAAPRARAG